ncbi:fumarylacetoacetate hydrolase family protein [Paraburkholderia sp. SIMBA_009]
MQDIKTLSLTRLAERLREAERTREPVAPLALDHALDDTSAYAIQRMNTDVRVRAGERVTGRKIGLTSPVVQRQLGVVQPDFGTLFASMAYGDAQPIPLGELIQPKVEAEIALVLGRDLLHERHTYADLLRAVDHALVAIEVVDSRIANWQIAYADTVADNASSARFVLGSRPTLLRHVDLASCYMTMSRRGELLADGTGSACMGNPLNAAAWLADRMVREGTPLRAGEIVLTGALGPMMAVTAPDSFDVTVEGFGSVRATFE